MKRLVLALLLGCFAAAAIGCTGSSPVAPPINQAPYFTEAPTNIIIFEGSDIVGIFRLEDIDNPSEDLSMAVTDLNDTFSGSPAYILDSSSAPGDIPGWIKITYREETTIGIGPIGEKVVTMRGTDGDKTVDHAFSVTVILWL